MIRIGIIGNSHLGALKRGWDRVSGDYPTVEATFFAVPTDELPNFAPSEDNLVPTTDVLRERMATSSGGLNAIPGSLDAFIAIGFGWHITHLLKLDQSQGEKGTAAEAFIRTLARQPAMDFLRKLRQCTAAPILLLAPPHQPRNHAEDFRDIDASEAKRIADTFDITCRHLAKEVGASFMSQPRATIASNLINTRAKFSNPPRDDGKIDRWHTNGDYGEIVVRKAVDRTLSMAAKTPARDP